MPAKSPPGIIGKRRAEKTQNVGDVERVHRGCVYFDEHLSGARLGHRLGTNDQRLRGRPYGRDDDCVHLLFGIGGHLQILSVVHLTDQVNYRTGHLIRQVNVPELTFPVT